MQRPSYAITMKLKKIVGKKLKAIRLKNDMTIQDLAERSKVSSNMISRIERGLTIPSVEILMKLASVFDKSINFFVEEVSTTHEIVFSTPGARDTTVYDDESNMHTEAFTSGLRDPQFMSFLCTFRGCRPFFESSRPRFGLLGPIRREAGSDSSPMRKLSSNAMRCAPVILDASSMSMSAILTPSFV